MKALKSISLSFVFSYCLSIALCLNAWGLSAQKIAQETFPSIVLLIMEDMNNQPVSLGSGFIVKSDIVVTNLHVLEDASGGSAKLVGKKEKYYIGGTVGIDRKVDLVLLSVKGVNAPALQLGDSEKVRIGDEIYAVGNPLGLEGTFSKGIISGIRKVGSENLFQITAPISPGSSGGPVLNTKGQVIGISVATFETGQNLNFAIPVSYLESLLEKISDIQPISNVDDLKNRKSIFYSLGNANIKSVIARAFNWQYGSVFSFSIYNKLRESITNVNCLVIFYDNEIIPIHAEYVFFGYRSEDHLFEEIDGYSWQEFKNRANYNGLSTELKRYAKIEYENWYKGAILKAKNVIQPGLAKIVIRGGLPNGTKEQTNTVKIRILDFKILE